MSGVESSQKRLLIEARFFQSFFEIIESRLVRLRAKSLALNLSIERVNLVVRSALLFALCFNVLMFTVAWAMWKKKWFVKV